MKIDELIISDLNIRKKLPEKEEINEIKESIRAKGVIEPLIVRPTNDGKYEIIIGQLRYLASKELGIKELPCIVKNLSDTEALEYSLIENLQRKDVDPIDVAQGLRKLYEKACEVTSQLSLRKFAEEYQQKIGISWRQILSYLSLLGLTPELQEMVSEGKLTIESGAKLKQLPAKEQKKFAEEFEELMKEKPLTQQEKEELIKKVKEKGVEEAFKEAKEEGKFIKIEIRIDRNTRFNFKLKKTYWRWFSEVAERLEKEPTSLLEEIIVEKLEEWGYKV